MTISRIVRPALLCAISSLIVFSATAEEKKRGHESQRGHEEWSRDCVDNQTLPEQGVDVPHDKEPVVIKRVEPEYPRIAKQAGLTGTVQLAVLVDRCGKARIVAIAKTSGTGALDDAAVYAVQQWRFRPAEARGNPVAVWVTLPIEFKLP